MEREFRTSAYVAGLLVGSDKVVVGDVDEVKAAADGHGPLTQAPGPSRLQLVRHLLVLNQHATSAFTNLDQGLPTFFATVTKNFSKKCTTN